jgi:hypothetical protein
MTGSRAQITPEQVTSRPRVAPGPAREPLTRQCTRCGAVGTHYLTCPGLRLPSGYRLSRDPGQQPDHSVGG